MRLAFPLGTIKAAVDSKYDICVSLVIPGIGWLYREFLNVKKEIRGTLFTLVEAIVLSLFQELYDDPT